MIGTKLNMLSGFREVFNWLGYNGTAWSGWVATFGVLWTIGLLVENRWIPYSSQYRGVKFGDLFLGLAIFMATFGLTFVSDVTGMWYQTPKFHWVVFSAGVGLMVVFKGGEMLFTQRVIKKFHDRGLSPSSYELNVRNAYTWRQHFSPSSIVHTVLIPGLFYLLVTMAAPVLLASNAPAWIGALIMFGVGGWFVNAGILDNKLPRPDLSKVHPQDGWFPKLREWLRKLFRTRRAPQQRPIVVDTSFNVRNPRVSTPYDDHPTGRYSTDTMQAEPAEPSVRQSYTSASYTGISSSRPSRHNDSGWIDPSRLGDRVPGDGHYQAEPIPEGTAPRDVVQGIVSEPLPYRSVSDRLGPPITVQEPAQRPEATEVVSAATIAAAEAAVRLQPQDDTGAEAPAPAPWAHNHGLSLDGPPAAPIFGKQPYSNS